MMRIQIIFLFLISSFVYADEGCVYDSEAFNNFKNEYVKSHKDAKLISDGKTIIITRNNEEIVINGGGCIHIGVSINIKVEHPHSEKEFLNRILDVSTEFGSWLLNIDELKSSIANNKWQKQENIYFIPIDSMTVFEAENSSKTINVYFYIN